MRAVSIPSRNDGGDRYSQTWLSRIGDGKNMTKTFAIALLLTMGVAPRPSSAADLFYMDHDTLTAKFTGADGPLVLSGEIVPGDYAHLVARIAQDEARYLAHNELIVAAEEGDVAEAQRIATLVTALHSEVIVDPQTGRCVGACFLIYAAAGERVTDGPALIGIRRLPGVEGFLHDNLVPESLLAEAANGRDLYVLTEQDEKLLGRRSPAFAQYLKTRCAWDDAVERGVMLGQRAPAELQSLLACRERVTRLDAHRALAGALAQLNTPAPAK